MILHQIDCDDDRYTLLRFRQNPPCPFRDKAIVRWQQQFACIVTFITLVESIFNIKLRNLRVMLETYCVKADVGKEGEGEA